MKELNLGNLAKPVKKSDGIELKVFFAAKTHKVDFPLIAVVTEDGSWPKVLGDYLQRKQNFLDAHDPFETRCTEGLVAALEEGLLGATSALSIDIKGLCYSGPHDKLFCAVRELIDETGVVRFQNECGVSAEAFLEFLALYPSSTIVQS